MIKSVVSWLVPHPYVKYCSQTIYQALLGCIKMYQATDLSIWETRADQLVEILISIQRPDGGFDIGYEFNFGRIHKKGDSTSPELVGLLAICEYARVFDSHDRVKPFADKAANWIRTFAIKQKDNTWAVPYSPYNTNEIMVYNGTSFACGGLGAYLAIFDIEDIKLIEIYHGMIDYLEKNLFSDNELKGRFWYYPVQSRTDISSEQLNKIDYYHQMQQVEMHSMAQQVIGSANQFKIIQDCSDHVIDLSNSNEIISYTNSSINFGGKIHVWGLCSVSSGLIEASKVIKDRSEEYLDYAQKVIDWLIIHSWNGQFFEPVLTIEGVVDENYGYMVRSDAWVFNALSTYFTDVKSEPYLEEIIEKTYLKMETVDFSGKESHASSLNKKIISKLVLMLRKVSK